jgi:geranylgeranyl diphosphate synthase type I
VTGSTEPPPGVWRFAAGFELLHTFFRVHDDVADAAEMRRGGPALHRMLAPDRMGQDLAVVAGDHLFARSLEAMLESELPEAQEVVAYVMRSCRHTAAGQFLDVQGVRVPLAEAKLRQSMKVAQLKTSRFGFIAPLVGGAMLAGAGGRLLVALERMGRNLGLAYQLRGELLALFGDPAAGVKPIDTDLLERKRSFPVLCAYARADAQDRREMEALWDGRIDASSVERARALVEKNGGRPCTERLLRRATMLTHQVLLTLPRSEASTLLSLLVVRLVERGG